MQSGPDNKRQDENYIKLIKEKEECNEFVGKTFSILIMQSNKLPALICALHAVSLVFLFCTHKKGTLSLQHAMRILRLGVCCFEEKSSKTDYALANHLQIQNVNSALRSKLHCQYEKCLFVYFKKYKRKVKEIHRADNTTEKTAINELFQEDKGKFMSFDKSRLLSDHTTFDRYVPNRNAYQKLVHDTNCHFDWKHFRKVKVPRTFCLLLSCNNIQKPY